MAHIADVVQQLIQHQRMIADAFRVNSSFDAIAKATESIRSQSLASANAVQQIHSQVASTVKALETLINSSVMFRELHRAAEQQREMIDGLLEPIRQLQKLNNPVIEYMKGIQSDYDALNRSLLSISPAHISIAADCVVAHAQGEIEISASDEADSEVEIDDPGGILAPVVHDLKKSPSFVALLVYVTMTLTTIVMSVVPNDHQHEAKELRDTLLALAAFRIIFEKLDSSWQKIASDDDEDGD